MSNFLTAANILMEKRTVLKIEQLQMNAKFDKEILDLEMAIETLLGDKFSDILPTEKFDDENPDYIKASLEEI